LKEISQQKTQMTTTNQATLIWAQRNEWCYIKIDLQDVSKEKIEFTQDGKFSFTGTSGGKVYTSSVQLYGEVDVEGSKFKVHARGVEVALKKKTAGWWKALTKDNSKSRFIKTDWNKWQDEDGDDYGKDLDTSGMGGMGDMGGMGGGMDFASMMAGGGGGAGGMDIASMLKNMPKDKNAGAGDDDDDDGDDDDTGADMPPLEDVKK